MRCSSFAMRDTLYNGPFPSTLSIPKPNFPSLSRPRNLPFSTLSSKSTLSLPPKPTRTQPHNETLFSPPPITPQLPPPDPHDDFQEKMLYLDSIGVDFFAAISDHPPVVSASLSDIKSTIDYMNFLGFTAIDFRRIVFMCPEVLSTPLKEIIPVFTFLLRECRVNGSDLRRIIHRRPRLLACSVKHRLRPTLYFLQTIGILDVRRHTSLLYCSVEDKLIPRIEYFQSIGFSHREALAMFRRFPALFCLGIKSCFEPKFDYLVIEMGRDFKELKEFPQYFSFSLENRIKARHKSCLEKGVRLPLRVLLKTGEEQFQQILERKTKVQCYGRRRNEDTVIPRKLVRNCIYLRAPSPNFTCLCLPKTHGLASSGLG